MLSRNNFSFASGVVEEVSTSQKTIEKRRRGGWFIFRGIWFIALPSTSIQSTTIQLVRLRTQEGQRNFTLSGQTLPVQNGHRIAVLWLGNHLVSVINHSTGDVLKLDGSLAQLAGKKPLSAFKAAMILFVIVFGILAVASGQEASAHDPEMHPFWVLSVIPLLLALGIVPASGFGVGLIRGKKYRARLSYLHNLVEEEVTRVRKT